MINRNNYEEYLLIYIDGELASGERAAVEAFLEAHPDLKEEFELLQQTVLQPEENIAFSGKNVLYRKEEGINLTNYQEYFLLYVDEELNAVEKEEVETFVLKNPELQDEFTLLKQTVLPAEQVVFANKEVLYRKEEKRRPVVISLRWASLAAAIMIGLVAMIWVLNGGEKTVTTDGGVAKKTEKGSVTTPKTTLPQQVLPVQPEETALTAQKQEQKRILNPRSNQQVQPNQSPDQQQQVAVVPQQKSTQPVIDVPVANTPGSNKPDAPIAYNGSPDENKVTTVSTPDVATNNNVQPAVYTEEMTTEEEKNKNLYVGALEINTDKVRGFFRKAGRFLSSKLKNKDEEDGGKVQVANLEVNKLK